MELSDPKKKLIEKLHEVFDVENADLDFGIYRVMNYKRKEIDQFISNRLVQTVEQNLGLIADSERANINKEVSELEKKIKADFGDDAFGKDGLVEKFRGTPVGKTYIDKLAQLEAVQVSKDVENAIYNHILNFFSRYYDKGDFIGKRRYGRADRYVVPYNGEEALLFWATKDQYYVKTTEWFRRFSFRCSDVKTDFAVTQVIYEDSESNGEDRYFLLRGESPADFSGDTLKINLEYRILTNEEIKRYGESAKQETINAQIVSSLKERLSSHRRLQPLFEGKGESSPLEKNLNKYTARNTSDYFIHKNLGGFLKTELDYYVKNEVLNLQNLESVGTDLMSQRLMVARVVSTISEVIIDFLSQIEDFQKRLWEKKKFVVKTDFVITLDRIKRYAGTEFFDEVTEEILSNRDQLREWEDLFKLKVKGRGNLEMTLPIDTRYFGEDFKWKLLTALTNKNGLDSILDGLVVKSENWQALNLLSNLFQGKIQAIYIDPPFKTGKDFLYKDHYQDSSWLTLMDNRLNEALPFLKRNASMFVHLDWNANYLGRQLLRKEFGALTEIAWNTNATTDEEAGLFSFKSFGEKLVRQHDTIFQCSRNGDFKFIKLWKPNRRTSTLEIGWLDLISYPNKKPAQRLEDFDFFVETYNQSGQLSFEGVVIKEKVFPIGDIWNDIFSFTQSEMRTSENVSFDTQKPENLLRRILQLSTEKGDAVMDFFAGSGTTLAVAHKLQRKWVGVEMGDFFENTYFDEGEKKLGLLGRIKNVLKGDKEFKAIDKDRRSHLSKDINWKGGGFFKYQVLEQYDDSLENVEFEQKQIPEFTDYFVKYMLGFETKDSTTLLNIDQLQDPLNYKIKVSDGYQSRTALVDLPETFNYLLGLAVERVRVVETMQRRYLLTYGKVGERSVLVVWRSISKLDFQKDKEIIEGFKKEFEPDEVFINGDAGVSGFKQIESEFKGRLW